MKHYAIKIDCGNDNNGNPRRGWYVYDSEGYLKEFIDHAYTGIKALRNHYPKAVELGSFSVTVTEYRHAMRYHQRSCGIREWRNLKGTQPNE